MPLTYVVVPDRHEPGYWRVEAIDEASEGECYVAIFSGPFAKQRAEEYRDFKERQGPSVFVPT